ncbi:non-hydrolyzing UDP-N-acetylglucosamine 2-epimerase [Solitalea koreensis]|uniref:UDP-N-acetylglucosamine 2-epimerase (Non-hydrolysing) n=1 Tax=Solitalea koreensis TaxID=543615 RepID=A0A521AN07_9SPHI|nr:UDP-N-acetylglucosamine 2-epimerase (non-hydrolyzing) [Solitalea koreensis]SMO36187.1 UDP-N-acetylglucosamine 2-epimerase (non-hydrolysing) [Solitalea koreensis]
MLIDIIAGARPNFMKIAPIIEAIENEQKNGLNLHYRLIHTGQHYDKKMSNDFFDQLGIPKPHINLNVGSGTQAEQTGKIMLRYEEVLLNAPSDMCLVVGDVTSTMACSIAAKKLNIKVAHVEAGIRSGDITMPEEINRIVTDSITDYFFTTSEAANNNLRKQGVKEENVFFVGNTMIDTLLKQMDRFIKPAFWNELNLKAKHYIVMTLHRPNNVDQESQLRDLINEITECCSHLPIVFPVHPRTAKMLTQVGISAPNLHLIEPLGYLEFNYLVKHAKAVITDSGGITEETTVMGIPCMTLRNSTERPETCTIGTNELLGTDPKAIKPAMQKIFDGQWKTGGIPELWDGNTSGRIVSVLKMIGKLQIQMEEIPKIE